LPGVKNAGIYQVMADSKNNLWMAEFTEGHLGKIDARTTEVTWYATPTAHARARRLQIDDQDRVLLTEYRTSKVAQFDPKTEKFIEYSLPEYTFPYRANFDKNGELWASTMSTDFGLLVNMRNPSNVSQRRDAETTAPALGSTL
jgi:virginiamycin B lyase